ncbi:chemotaxis protein CheA [Novosphingobium sp. PC22D]|uniref:chemotaxis protein CheA n=1 Tax=Novosphingobium sp. PC22D TaxID=1962403 RepID=UPI000BF10E12|nr:chemotaxis protein CheA [Novosphingobium sp. PC22D]PEQ13422.1 chemotaxis protein CheA [Novosphingobium sp. PC22D]
MSSVDPKDTFRAEANDLLEQLEKDLLDLSASPDSGSLIDGVFRALHTIKGSGAMFGFTVIADFVHAFETAFDRVRKGEAKVTPELVNLALRARDNICALIDGGDDAASAGILSELDRIVSGGTAAGAGASTWTVRFKLAGDAVANGANPVLLLDEIRAIGPTRITAITDDVPALADLDPEALHLAWEAEIEHIDPTEAIEDVFLFLRDDMELSIVRRDPVGESDADAPKAADSGPAAGVGQDGVAPAIRVSAERLDELMDRVGELVTAQARLSQLANIFKDPSLSALAEDFERLTSGMRETTMEIRMVPIGTIFGRFRRLVHDLSCELGKDIALDMDGEDTELDKTVIERLADPMVHLIRNACDHGLETTAQRLTAGKGGQGTIRLQAACSGTEVRVIISDDGAGLDVARIRARAIEAGIIPADREMSEEEVHQLIFEPGFSTAREVTALSGRGVGMDVVKRTIEALHGHITVSSRPAEGTRICLHLPLTLAIIDGILVRVGDGKFTIPLTAVEECVELDDNIAETERGRSFLNIRGTLVPYIRLRQLFGTRAPADPYPKVVIISSGENRVGLVVDQILGNSQTVIKQLSRLHARAGAFSGATVLGDGAVALILDPSALVSRGKVEAGEADRKRPAELAA